MKKGISAALCIALLLAASVPAAAAGTEDAGFYDVGAAERIEIVPLSESGEAVEAVARNVDGSDGDELFYPGSTALDVTLDSTAEGTWYLLTVSAGDTVCFADQQSGGGPVAFHVAFALPPERTDLTLRIGSNAEGFAPIIVALSYTPEAADAPEQPSPDPAGAVSDCPRNEACVMAAFSDLEPSAWYHDGIHFALASGLMQGYGDGVFAPDGTASRAMTAQILWNMEGRPEAQNGAVFADVAEDAWYAGAVRWASDAGIITGWTDAAGEQRFDPDAAVTREQAAAMLYRYAKLHGEGFAELWSFPLDFPDAGDAAQWAYEPLCWMVMRGVINGMDGKLNPQGSATRAQLASMLFRFTLGA